MMLRHPGGLALGTQTCMWAASGLHTFPRVVQTVAHHGAADFGKRGGAPEILGRGLRGLPDWSTLTKY